MIAKRFLLVAIILSGAPATGWAQSQTGSNFGTLPSGSAASRSNGGSSYSHSRHRDSGGGEQSAHGNGGDSSNGGGREIDARDAERTSPVARQASTPQH
jgi:hypothetical protein